MLRTTMYILALGLACAAAAQPYPSKPVRLILPFGPGSATDIAARLLQERLTATWGKPIVIENKPGGDGIVAINAFVTAADDHVLLYASSASFMAHPYTQEKLPYDMKRDLEPIARVTDTILSATVPAASGIKTLREFIAKARASGGAARARTVRTSGGRRAAPARGPCRTRTTRRSDTGPGC